MNDFYVKQITLPSGKTVDVVYFGEPEPEVTSPHDTPVDLSVCPCCDRSLVQPLTWREFGDWHWHLTLRCPNCEWFGDGVWDHATIMAYDAKLNEASDDLVYAIRAFERETSWRDL